MRKLKNILIGLLTALIILLAIHNLYQDKAIRDITTEVNTLRNIQRQHLFLIFDLEDAIYETDTITGDRQVKWEK